MSETDLVLLSERLLGQQHKCEEDEKSSCHEDAKKKVWSVDHTLMNSNVVCCDENSHYALLRRISIPSEASPIKANEPGSGTAGINARVNPLT